MNHLPPVELVVTAVVCTVRQEIHPLANKEQSNLVSEDFKSSMEGCRSLRSSQYLLWDFPNITSAEEVYTLQLNLGFFLFVFFYLVFFAPGSVFLHQDDFPNRVRSDLKSNLNIQIGE